ncbi:HD domain-containing phosphohydrolase [Cobetia marina]|uniref:HD domain-containing phosphohydrolase n=1 Tax=Cobetia marina TaxID=28258 RepID=A0ABU9GJX2_COBMA
MPNYLYQPPYGVATLAPEALDLLERLYRHDADTLAHSWRVAGLSVSLYARLLDTLGEPLRTLSIEIAVGHHECWDGSGYPGQIMTQALPLHCRVVGLMDVFDAVASPRAYKAGWPLDRLIALFVAQAGRQFDPQLIGRLSPLWKELLAVHHQLLDQTRSD